MGRSTNIDPLYAEKALTEPEYLLRVEFVKLYMWKRDPFNACIALGFLEAYAQDWADTFMSEGLVQRLIRVAEQTEETPESKDQRKNQLKALMEEHATFKGGDSSHSARVSATAHLMKVEGMEAPSKVEANINHKGGVMVVPAMSTADEWGSGAADSQSNLKASVRD